MFLFIKKMFANFMNNCESITVEQLSDAPEKYYVIDVREPWELSFGCIEPSLKIPMGEIREKLNTLPTDKPLVIVCRSGGRSAQVTQYLCSQGFSALNLHGGIRAWAKFVDPSIKDY